MGGSDDGWRLGLDFSWLGFSLFGWKERGEKEGLRGGLSLSPAKVLFALCFCSRTD